MKVIAEIHFLNKGKGGKEIVTYQVVTIPVDFNGYDVSMSSPIKNSYNYHANPPFTLSLPATHYTTSQDVFAWDGIDITGDITAEPGVRVNIISDGYIDRHGFAVNSGITYSAFQNYSPDCWQDPVGGDVAAVFGYCSSGNYKADQCNGCNPYAKVGHDAPEIYSNNAHAKRIAFWVHNPIHVGENIYLSNGYETTLSYVQISDLQGRLLFEKVVNLENGNGMLPILNLAPGVYSIIVQNEAGVNHSRILVQP